MIYLNRGGNLLLAFTTLIATFFSFNHSFGFNPVTSDKYIYRKVPDRRSVTSKLFFQMGKGLHGYEKALSDFKALYGDQWTFSWDSVTGTPLLAQGSGIELLGQDSGLKGAEAACRDFVERNSDLFGIRSENMLLDAKMSGNAGPSGEMWFVHFSQTYSGVPVLDSNIFFRYKYGRLLQFGSESYPGIDIDSRPVLSEKQALTRAMRIVKFDQTSDLIESSGRLFIYPRLTDGKYSYRLVYENIFFKAEPYGEWVIYIDATDGAVVEKYSNTYFFQGRLVGLVHPRTATDHLLDVPFPNVSVNVAGIEEVLTDRKGIFGSRIGNVTQVSMLVGGPGAVSRQCDTVYVGGSDYAKCEGATTRVVFRGNEDWNNQDSVLFSLDDSNTTPAERDAYYSISNVTGWAKRFIKSDWFMKRLLINVNIAEMVERSGWDESREKVACNAFYDGRSINFFAEGSVQDENEIISCNNTASIADIVYHEWGHGLDDNTGGIDDPAFSEGIGDIVSFMMTGDFRIAPGFYKEIPSGEPGTYIRDISIDRIYPRDKDSDPHLEGLIISSAWWDLRDYLIGRYGNKEGSDRSAYLFLVGIKTARKYTDSYPATLVVDDDDGNLANGTPNKDLIARAFSEHGLFKE